jgi:HD superfamily phosphohydrolase/serine/threonine protein kinase
MSEFLRPKPELTSEERKREDLYLVLSIIWKAADHSTDWVKTHLDDSRRYPVGRDLDLVDKICGHDLKLASDRPISVGGGGVVIPCVEAAPELDADHQVRYALKVARPSLFADQAEASTEFKKARAEYLTHLPLSHENIAKMFAIGEVLISQPGYYLRIPCTLIEWIDDALPIDRCLLERVTSAAQVADLLAQACRGLEHLHRSGKVHWDIKGDNVLVGGDGVVKLMDLGNARPLQSQSAVYDAPDAADTTDQNLPPELQQRVRALKKDLVEREARPPSENRVPCPLLEGEKSWDRPWLDLYMLTREVNRILALDQAVLAHDASGADFLSSENAASIELFGDDDGRFAAAYFRRIFRRILAADNPEEDAFYESADSLVRALERLTPEYGEATDINELQVVPQHVLRVPPADNVPWTERVRALMTTRPLLRLKSHRQLATVVQVFPGAEHTRWEHAAGTFNVALQYVRALYADRTSVFFRLDTSKRDVLALMLATLIHDLGHPSFGHQLEETPAVPPELHHETYALRVLRACLGMENSLSPQDPAVRDSADIRPVLDAHWTTDEVSADDIVSRAIEILSARGAPVEPDEGRNSRARRVHTELLASIVTGQLDADKADYLVRDAHHCGVEYPNGIDRGRLQQALTSIVAARDGTRRGMLGVSHKGILPLESLLIARYQMFRAVYWQHTVRAMTVMLQELVERYLIPDLRSSRLDTDRVEELLDEFRSQRDEDAIRWLAARVAPQLPTFGAALVGDRKHIYWRVAELRGRDELAEASPLTHVEDEIYTLLSSQWTPVQGADPGEVTHARRELRTRFAAHLSAAALLDPPLAVDDVLLDVPLSSRDEVSGLYVALDDQPGRPTVSLEELTPLAAAVGTAFRSSVRPIRVFLEPKRAAMVAGNDEAAAEFAGACVSAMGTLVRPVLDADLMNLAKPQL